MKDAELYSGIVDPKKQAEYEAWTEETCGPEIKDHIETSRKRMERLTSAERGAMMAELKDIEAGLATELRKGTQPQARALDPLIERHFAWVKSSWGQDAPVSSYAGLADAYLAHPDFVARYERVEPGFAGFLATAMRSWAARQ